MIIVKTTITNPKRHFLNNQKQYGENDKLCKVASLNNLIHRYTTFILQDIKMFPNKYLHFTRRKISFFVIPSLLVSLVFIFYQITIFVQLSNENKTTKKPNLVRGIHEQESRFYMPNSENQFTCIRSLEIIDFRRLNDDYCDCLDGSDEPGTSACPNGLFFCENQIDMKNFRKAVHSSKVNDGICDCCDGSDEWENNRVLNNLDEESQKKAARFHVPCPKMC